MGVCQLRLRGAFAPILCLALATAMIGSPLAKVGAADFVPTTTRVNVSSSGVQANGDSEVAAISADGRYVAFTSPANNLAGVGNPSGDAYVKDTQTGAIECVNVSSEEVHGNGPCYSEVAISADGRFVAFASVSSNLVEADSDDSMDIYVRDRVAGTTELVSKSSTGVKGNDGSSKAAISADGRFVVFESGATNLVPGEPEILLNVFVHDRQTGATEQVDVSSAEVPGNSHSYSNSISADGRFVTFSSSADNLVADDTNGAGDIFVRDLQEGSTERVSLSSTGEQADGDSGYASISGDGRYVGFSSFAENLVEGDTNGNVDVFVRDLQEGTTERVSLSSAGEEHNGDSAYIPVLSADGRYVAFQSNGSNLVPEDSDADHDIFVRDRETSETVWISVPTDPSGTSGNEWETAISADGSRVVFISSGSDIVPGDTNGTSDVFLREWFGTTVNEAPVAVADAYSTPEDTALVIAAEGVLANDTDAEDDTLTAIKVTDPAHGTVSLGADGSFTYTPVADYNGPDSFTYKANDATTDSNVATVTLTVTPVEDLPPVIPIAGANRFTTAVAASVEAYPDGLDDTGARTVVIATGRNWPDALGGSSLAGVLDGPILLVDTNAVPAEVTAEITRLDADKAIILGGIAAVSDAVEAALKTQLGATDVDRIAGANRYETADKIASAVIDLAGAGFEGTAFVATGAKFPDALGAAPLAAANAWPLYLANPSSGLSAATKAAMDGVDTVLVLGGEAVVPADVETYLNTTYGDANVTRLFGADRYETAVKVAAYGVDHAGLGWNRVAIATGVNFPDALAGGVLQGRVGSVMLLTKPDALNAYTSAALAAHEADISTVTFFGGLGALPQVVRDQVATALE